MRKIQTTKEQSELRRLSQACFLLLAAACENIRDHSVPNYSGASSCAGKFCTNATLVSQRLEGCSLLDISAFLLHSQSFMRSPKTKPHMGNEQERVRPSCDLPGLMSLHALRPNNPRYASLIETWPCCYRPRGTRRRESSAGKRATRS